MIVTLTCLECHVVFGRENPDTSTNCFCSKSCAAKYNNRISPKRKPEGTCHYCGKPSRTIHKWCSNQCKMADLTKTAVERTKTQDQTKKLSKTQNKTKEAPIKKDSFSVIISSGSSVIEWRRRAKRKAMALLGGCLFGLWVFQGCVSYGVSPFGSFTKGIQHHECQLSFLGQGSRGTEEMRSSL